MGLKRETLNKRIRATVSSLSDEDLVAMLEAPKPNYTPFARQVAREELSRRRQIKAAQNDASPAPAPDPGAFRKEPADYTHKGCYIEVWSEKDFGGEYLRIEGPIEHRALDVASLNWNNSISSLRVGPSAFVLVYADEDYKGAMMSFGPSQSVANLDELSFNDEIDSITVVNSLKVFDGLRADDPKQIADCRPEKKQNAKSGRRKKRGGRDR